MAIKDYSTDPDLNVQISGINIAEGCPPSGINNAIRQLMADVKVEKDTRDAEQAAKDAAQDAAISTAQNTANAAGQAAANAQTSADAALAKEAVLPGSVIAWAANSTPNGYLLCNGAAVSRTTYKALFDTIGTIYGGGNGSTTFNLPNLTGRFIQGYDDEYPVGTYKEAGVPELEGTLGWMIASESYTASSNSALYFSSANTGSRTRIEPGSSPGDPSFKASRYNSIYGTSNTVQPPALTMRYYIKY